MSKARKLGVAVLYRGESWIPLSHKAEEDTYTLQSQDGSVTVKARGDELGTAP